MTIDRDALAALVAASRALGSDPSLVLHGGGNTSIKGVWHDVTGRDVPTLYVKGSGHDLATIDEDGFAPLRLERLRELLPPVRLGDLQLRDELRCATLDPAAPDPSVETLVHALLPHRVVLHSHADDLLALTNTADGRTRVRDLYGDDVVIVDYAMPGPDLVAACADAIEAHGTERLLGLVVLRHGLFAVGDDAEQALATHTDLIGRARAALDRAATERARDLAVPAAAPVTGDADERRAMADLRARISAAAGRPMIVQRHGETQSRAVLDDPALLDAAQRGPLTPDHVIFTKRVPLIGDDVEAYADAYRTYFEANRSRRDVPLTMLDPAPRVVLHPQLGLCSVGRTATEAGAAADIARHTLATIARAEDLGGYEPADDGHVFDLEYWALQQDKLHRRTTPAPLTGQVALVTGAASGIGRACAAALLDAGAAVVGLDRAPEVATTFEGPDWLGLEVDVTDTDAIERAVSRTVATYGGLDVLVVAAGIFPPTEPLGQLDLTDWQRTMAVNVDAVVALYGLVGELLAAAPEPGRVIVIASKNVLAPGPGAAAYSASKAAVTQLSRVAALEWAPAGVRVNMIHPDAVFDTGLWTEELLAARAANYGMSIEEYKRRNLLRTEVTSADVGQLTLAMATAPFACTTGAQVPIDGGSDRIV
ncbi:MAG: bifunctional aldolase/short-chain dehydrogenase [Nitriliruptoraceae bacterium]|nr:bifunctional aldolase/short-chain dehydrogenase [Nitriliruptoraceae bacterium]